MKTCIKGTSMCKRRKPFWQLGFIRLKSKYSDQLRKFVGPLLRTPTFTLTYIFCAVTFNRVTTPHNYYSPTQVYPMRSTTLFRPIDQSVLWGDTQPSLVRQMCSLILLRTRLRSFLRESPELLSYIFKRTSLMNIRVNSHLTGS